MSMSGSAIRVARLCVAALAACALLGLTTASAWASSEVIFNNVNGNLPAAEGFDCCGLSQEGSEVEFEASRLDRFSPKIGVEMISFGCETGGAATCVTGRGASFSWPVTLNVYNVGATPETVGSLIVSSTKTFKIPYRPSENPSCPNEGWTKGYGKKCLFGREHRLQWSLHGVTLPSKVIIAVAFETEQYGDPEPGSPAQEQGADSLNVGVMENSPPNPGIAPLPEQVFLEPNGSNSGYAIGVDSCGTGMVGVFAVTPPACYGQYQVAIEVSAK